ncbi:hypothetical protein [Actinocrinis sp.]|uniref:hypothetical protein n=1 Tax=Actinocrinis sp. TaxID=1920516 RepID=UPI002DDD11C4|nr:hypothetical protein [Actinocrinis sp.]
MAVSAAHRVRNEKLRSIRLAMNMSLTNFATAVRDAGDALGEPNTCDKRLVNKWESGAHSTCLPRYRRALQRVTSTPYIELGFADATKVAPLSPTVSSLIGTPASLDDSILILGDPNDALRYSLNRPEVPQPKAIALIAESTAYLFGLEYHRPARALMPALGQHVRDVAAMMTGTRHQPFRHRLATAGGQASLLAGWLAFDLGDMPAAHRYWDSAMACARYAADGPLFACILTYLSYSAADRGDPHTAWQLAHTAVSRVGPNPRAQAWMAVRAAQEAAKIGDSGAAIAELEEALDYGSEMASAAPEDDAEPWCRFVDRAYIWAMASNVYTHLGAVDDAHASAVRALDSLSADQVKTRAIVLAEAAHAFARIGGTERAIQCATEAADLASKLEASLAHRRLRELLPHLAVTAASQLAPRLREQPASPAN